MTIEDYRRNLRGVNDGTDFSATFLVRRWNSGQAFATDGTSSKTSMTQSESEKL